MPILTTKVSCLLRCTVPTGVSPPGLFVGSDWVILRSIFPPLEGQPCRLNTAIHSFIGSLAHSFTLSFTHSVTYSFITHLFIPSLLHSLIHSFTHSFIHSLIHSFITTLIHSLINLLTPSFTHSFTYSLIHSFIHSLSFLHSFITYSFTYSLTYLFIHLLTHSFTYSFTHSLAYSLIHSLSHTQLPGWDTSAEGSDASSSPGSGVQILQAAAGAGAERGIEPRVQAAMSPGPSLGSPCSVTGQRHCLSDCHTPHPHLGVPSPSLALLPPGPVASWWACSRVLLSAVSRGTAALPGQGTSFPRGAWRGSQASGGHLASCEQVFPLLRFITSSVKWGC